MSRECSTDPAEPVVKEVPVSDIAIGDRARKEVGNLLQLADSIDRVGLLHPPVVNGRMELIAGFRRLKAVEKLGWTTVPVRVVESLDDATLALKAEMQENTCRLDLTYTEMVELGRRIEELEKPAAAARERSGTNQHTEPSGKLPEGSKGDTRDKVAAAVGTSGRTYEKGKQVVQAAERDPERYGDLPALMDSKSVHAAHQELKARAAEEPAPTPRTRGHRAVADRAKLVEGLAHARKAAALFAEALGGPAGVHLAKATFEGQPLVRVVRRRRRDGGVREDYSLAPLDVVVQLVRDLMPRDHACGGCAGKGCGQCRDAGAVPVAKKYWPSNDDRQLLITFADLDGDTEGDR